MTRSTEIDDYEIGNWLRGLGDAEWRALPHYYQQLLVEKYGLRERGLELGLQVEGYQSWADLARKRGDGGDRHTLRSDALNALRFLMGQILLNQPDRSRGFPPELVETTMIVNLRDKPTG